MMRNGAKPGAAKSSAGEWDGAAWDRLMARWAGIGAVDLGDRGGGEAAATVAPSPAMSSLPAVFKLSTLNGSNGFRLDGSDEYDFSGIAVSSAGDINGDGFDDIIIGANNADPGGDLSAGESYVVFGKADGFAASLNLRTLDGSNGFRLDGKNANDASGASVSSAGDINSDGFDDIIIGANGASESYVVFGKADGFDARLNLAALDGTNGFRLDGWFDDGTGTSVSSAGDINGDGFDDIILGAPSAIRGVGASYVVFGKASGFASSLDLASLDGSDGFRLDGVDYNGSSGRSVSSAGDINGDGFDDIIIGAHFAYPGGDSRAGESYVVFGKASGFAASLDLSSLNGDNGFSLEGIDASDYSGWSVSDAGDVNGDGFDDVIISARFADPDGNRGAGESYVVFGKASGFAASLDLATLDGTNGFRLDGVERYDQSGFSVSSAGDVNGDGFDDVIVGAHYAYEYAGASYIVFGKAGGFAASLDLATLDGTNGIALYGDAYSQGGRAVSSAGDVNGDGFDDIVIGALRGDPGGDSGAGESYVVFGRAPDEAVRRVGSAADQTIRGGDFGDALIGRRGDDILAGGARHDRLKGGAGEDDFAFASVDARDSDRIRDFTPGDDRIALDGDIFGLAEGALALGRFFVGGAARGANDRLIYDGATGELFFDADGTGAQAQVLIATLNDAPILTAADFIVI